MNGDITVDGSQTNKIVKDIRVRKGLKPEIPTLDEFYDKL
jgi:elongation factor 2